MARYRVYGTASVSLMTEFDDDEREDLYYQAIWELRREAGPVPSLLNLDFNIDDIQEIGPAPPTLGELIKERVARARAWVMGE